MTAGIAEDCAMSSPRASDFGKDKSLRGRDGQPRRAISSYLLGLSTRRDVDGRRVCKTLIAGSIPAVASAPIYDQEPAVPSTSLRSGKVEAIESHHLVPCSHEVTHEPLLRVVTRVDLRDGSELGVRAENEVDGGAGPLELACGAIATLIHVLTRDRCLPLRPHVEQVHEEVVGKHLGPVSEDAVLRSPEVGV